MRLKQAPAPADLTAVERLFRNLNCCLTYFLNPTLILERKVPSP
jgi:hypothetical protein